MSKDISRLQQEAINAITEHERRVAIVQAEVFRENARATQASDQLSRGTATLMESQRQLRMA